jgi:hypothetical protein
MIDDGIGRVDKSVPAGGPPIAQIAILPETKRPIETSEGREGSTGNGQVVGRKEGPEDPGRVVVLVEIICQQLRRL